MAPDSSPGQGPDGQGPDGQGPDGQASDGQGPGEPENPELRPRPQVGWSSSVRERLAATFYRPPSQGGTGSRMQPAPRSEPSEPSEERPLTEAERRRRIHTIDATERRVGYLAAALGVVVAIAFNVGHVIHPNEPITATPGKHRSCPSGYRLTELAHHTYQCWEIFPRSEWVERMVILLVLALAILVTVRIGRRAALAFTILITGVASETVITALPFLVAGGWLILRAWRTQRYGSPTARGAMAGAGAGRAGGTTGGTSASPRPPRGGSTSARSGGGNRPGGGRGAKGKTQPGVRQPPAASKRYTPKSPKRKRPPPPE